jgi:hypothetical protein
MFSTSGSSIHPGVSDSTSVRARAAGEHRLQFAAAASTIGSSTFACFTMNSRMMPIRIPLSAPAAFRDRARRRVRPADSSAAQS